MSICRKPSRLCRGFSCFWLFISGLRGLFSAGKIQHQQQHQQQQQRQQRRRRWRWEKTIARSWNNDIQYIRRTKLGKQVQACAYSKYKEQESSNLHMRLITVDIGFQVSLLIPASIDLLSLKLIGCTLVTWSYAWAAVLNSTHFKPRDR